MATKKKKISKKTKKKSKPKVRDGLLLELDGVVNLVEIKNGVESRNELDGNIVLKALMSFLTDAVNLASTDKDFQNKVVESAKKKK